MRIFVLGAGATGSLIARLLMRQGHQVTCGDRDPVRARRFLGRKSTVPVRQVNARNLWSIVRAARGSHLIVNASPAVVNKIVLRAALRLRAHYLDTASHQTDTPFQAEQLQMRVKLATGELLYFIYTTDSRNSETRYYPISQLPGDIGTKLRDEVKRLGG